MSKLTLCPGPGALIPEWKNSQKEFFGRGDDEYKKIKKRTLDWLSRISSKDIIVPIPGAATTAAYVCFENFLSKKILIINTGFYSQRWIKLVSQIFPKKNIFVCDYNKIHLFKKKVNWIVFVYVETSECKIFDIKKISKLKKKLKAKLMLDATASIGLEKHHNLSDVLFFSSCKGLLGPTGLGFIGFNNSIKISNKTNFFTDIDTHKNSSYTLGYNCMSALNKISKKHSIYLKKIKFARNILLPISLNKDNPMIGLDIKNKVLNKNRFKNVVFYQPRDKKANQLVFFLGFIKFSNSKIKRLIKNLFRI